MPISYNAAFHGSVVMNMKEIWSGESEDPLILTDEEIYNVFDEYSLYNVGEDEEFLTESAKYFAGLQQANREKRQKLIEDAPNTQGTKEFVISQLVTLLTSPPVLEGGISFWVSLDGALREKGYVLVFGQQGICGTTLEVGKVDDHEPSR